MMNSFWAMRLLHIGTGTALYAVFQAWGVLAETSAPDAPPRLAPGSNEFALGQGVAVAGVVGLSLLCGRVLFQTLQAHDLEFIPLWVGGFLVLIESLSAALSLPLNPERLPIEIPSFRAGRDLILRHSAPLFLGLTSTCAWLGPSTSTMVAAGCVFGWGIGQILSGPAQVFSVEAWSRRFAAIVGCGMGIVLLRAAIKWTF